MKSDIQNEDDVKELVNAFYDAVKKDGTLASVFAHVNWPMHLPKMYSFWNSMLLGASTYRGNPLAAHVTLDINENHFNAWVGLWHQTIDSLFAGKIANEAKARGAAIAVVFQAKMGIAARKY
jgi:hemoglobin